MTLSSEPFHHYGRRIIAKLMMRGGREEKERNMRRSLSSNRIVQVV